MIEIGRKSLNWAGLAVFGTGQILACFHWMGIVDVSNERLMRLANGLEKNGALSLRNHAGRWSNPVDVDFRLSCRPQKRWTDNVKVTMENRGSTLTAVVRNKIYLDRRRWRDFTDRPLAYL